MTGAVRCGGGRVHRVYGADERAGGSAREPVLSRRARETARETGSKVSGRMWWGRGYATRGAANAAAPGVLGDRGAMVGAGLCLLWHAQARRKGGAHERARPGVPFRRGGELVTEGAVT